eukprot:m.45331 g.45331  ORF g.45331 m.45331 type:complete len:1711 (+) comp10231_c0_seq1:262-5394(+)
MEGNGSRLEATPWKNSPASEHFPDAPKENSTRDDVLSLSYNNASVAALVNLLVDDKITDSVRVEILDRLRVLSRESAGRSMILASKGIDGLVKLLVDPDLVSRVALLILNLANDDGGPQSHEFARELSKAGAVEKLGWALEFAKPVSKVAVLFALRNLAIISDDCKELIVRGSGILKSVLKCMHDPLNHLKDASASVVLSICTRSSTSRTQQSRYIEICRIETCIDLGVPDGLLSLLDENPVTDAHVDALSALAYLTDSDLGVRRLVLLDGRHRLHSLPKRAKRNKHITEAVKYLDDVFSYAAGDTGPAYSNITSVFPSTVNIFATPLPPNVPQLKASRSKTLWKNVPNRQAMKQGVSKFLNKVGQQPGMIQVKRSLAVIRGSKGSAAKGLDFQGTANIGMGASSPQRRGQHLNQQGPISSSTQNIRGDNQLYTQDHDNEYQQVNERECALHFVDLEAHKRVQQATLKIRDEYDTPSDIFLELSTRNDSIQNEIEDLWDELAAVRNKDGDAHVNDMFARKRPKNSFRSNPKGQGRIVFPAHHANPLDYDPETRPLLYEALNAGRQGLDLAITAQKSRIKEMLDLQAANRAAVSLLTKLYIEVSRRGLNKEADLSATESESEEESDEGEDGESKPKSKEEEQLADIKRRITLLRDELESARDAIMAEEALEGLKLTKLEKVVLQLNLTFECRGTLLTRTKKRGSSLKPIPCLLAENELHEVELSLMGICNILAEQVDLEVETQEEEDVQSEDEEANIDSPLFDLRKKLKHEKWLREEEAKGRAFAVEEMNAADLERAKSKKKLEETVAAHNQLQSDYDTCSASLKEANSTNQEYASEIVSMRQQIEELTADLENTKVELEASEATERKLGARVQSLTKALQGVAQERDEIEQFRIKLEKAMAKERKEFEEVCSAQKDLVAEFEELKLTHSDLEATFADTCKDLDASQTTVSQMEVQQVEDMDRLKSYACKLLGACKADESLADVEVDEESATALYAAHLDMLDRIMETNEEYIVGLNDQVVELEAQVAVKEKQIVDLEVKTADECDELFAAKKAAETQNSNLQVHIQELEQELEIAKNATVEKATAESKAKEFEDKCKVLQDQNEIQASELSMAIARLNTAEEERDGMRERCHELIATLLQVSEELRDKTAASTAAAVADSTVTDAQLLADIKQNPEEVLLPESDDEDDNKDDENKTISGGNSETGAVDNSDDENATENNVEEVEKDDDVEESNNSATEEDSEETVTTIDGDECSTTTKTRTTQTHCVLVDEKQYEALNVELKKQRAAHAEVERELEVLSVVHDAVKQELEQTSRELDTIRMEKAQIQKTAEAAKNSEEESIKVRDFQEAQIARLVEIVERLEICSEEGSPLLVKSAERDEIHEQCVDLVQNLLEMEESLHELQEKLDDMEDKYKNEFKSGCELAKKYSELEKNYVEVISDCNDATKTRDHFQKQVELAQETMIKLDNAEQELGEMREALTTADNKYAMLHSEKEDLQRAKTKQQDELIRQKSKLEADLSELQGRFNEVLTVAETLGTDLNASKDALGSVESEMESLLQSRKQLQRQVEELEEADGKNTKIIEALHEKVAEITTELAGKDLELNSAHIDEAGTNTMLKAVQMAAERESLQNAKLMQEKEELERDLNALRQVPDLASIDRDTVASSRIPVFCAPPPPVEMTHEDTATLTATNITRNRPRKTTSSSRVKVRRH